MAVKAQITAKEIKVKGLVQGVGFRPFIYRLAYQYNVLGWVENRNDGVIIHAEANIENISRFLKAIKTDAPAASNIFKLSATLIEPENFQDFKIVKSSNTSDSITDISPDIAVCDACLHDLKTQAHRIEYPFINCTNCGPRFSIIRDLPYDREKTTMKPFVMCDTCHSEYVDVLDRRFHAQPVACNTCGPEYCLHEGEIEIHDYSRILSRCVDLLRNGKIIAIKGVGGFQLACDATNEQAVNELRLRKLREGKPFAVMFANLQTLKEYTLLSDVEEKVISSWRRPIVLVESSKKLASGVSVGFHTVGAMLPYMPFHYQLFEQLNLPAIVLTSGNISDEPIVIDNEKAEAQLSKIADAILDYNREIYNRTDDSVCVVMNNRERLIRRSRGYVPEPINLHLNVDGIVAMGAELVNCFCVGKGQQAILSQHIGDLKNLETLEFFEESYHRFLSLFRVKPALLVHDMHPDYLSTRMAYDLPVKTLAVQHHHAHIASCMAEFNLDEKVIGVSMDGTGLGDDGNIWGGEFFICDLEAYRRYTHFHYMPLPGGDRVTKQPWRSAVSLLYQVYGRDFLDLDIPFLQQLDHQKAEFLVRAIDKNLNCPLSSSAGRLFDAVAALLTICSETSFHAEAPMRLEAVADPQEAGAYPFDLGKPISFKPTIEAIVEDIQEGEGIDVIAARFHLTLVNVIFAVANEIRKETGIDKIVLSGGTFQNKYLLERVEIKLLLDGFKVFTQGKVPSNDGGLALGQLVIAAKRRANMKSGNE